jgi:hypothetical protein
LAVEAVLLASLVVVHNWGADIVADDLAVVVAVADGQAVAVADGRVGREDLDGQGPDDRDNRGTLHGQYHLRPASYLPCDASVFHVTYQEKGMEAADHDTLHICLVA